MGQQTDLWFDDGATDLFVDQAAEIAIRFVKRAQANPTPTLEMAEDIEALDSIAALLVECELARQARATEAREGATPRGHGCQG